jgi:hypothetical protein
MNVISLAHSYVQNQQSSWIDDPFQLGTNAVKGVTKRMSHKRTLTNYAEELVASYAKFVNEQYELSLDMLPTDEQNELVRLYIESIDREIEYACYGEDESINSDYLCAMLSMLKNDCLETREHFAEVTRKNLLTYYASSLEDVLDDACNSYHHMINNEQGLYAQQDRETGEIYWGKF